MTETDPSPKDDGIPHRSSISHLACVGGGWARGRETQIRREHVGNQNLADQPVAGQDICWS